MHDDSSDITGSAIEAAPLQLYAAALIFAPKTSVVRKQFLDQLPQWIHHLPEVEEAWYSALHTFETGSPAAEDELNPMVFSPSGQLLAYTSGNDIKIRNPTTGALFSSLEGHSDRVCAVCFSPDGQHLASASLDNTVRFWNIKAGTCHPLASRSETVAEIAFAKDGQVLVSCGQGILIWDLEMGIEHSTVKEHWNAKPPFTISPNCRLVASTWENEVKIWDLEAEAPRHTFNGHNDRLNAVVFSPDGQLIASVSYNGILKVWSTATGVLVGTFLNDRCHMHAIAFSVDGQLIACAAHDVKVWEVETARLRISHQDYNDPYARVLSFSPDGQHLACSTEGYRIMLWNTRTWECCGILIGHSSPIFAIVYSPNGQLLTSTSDDGTIRLWEPRTGNFGLDTCSHSSRVTEVAFAPCGTVFASASWDGTVKVWDSQTGLLSHTFEGHTEGVLRIVFSPTGDLLASASCDKTVKLWNVETAELVNTLRHRTSIFAIAFSPDGTVLASAAYDGVVKLWHAQTWQLLYSHKYHSGQVRVVAFSLNGRLLISGSVGEIMLCDIAMGMCFDKIPLDGCPDAVAVSSDGLFLAASFCGPSPVVIIWRIETKEVVRELYVKEDIHRLSFSSDGLYLRTDRGNLAIHSPSGLISDLRPDGSYLYIKEQWVTFGTEKLLWLPSHYRATEGRWADHNNCIVIGYESGRVSLMKLTYTGQEVEM